MNYLCPSILAADFWELGKQIELVEQAARRICILMSWMECLCLPYPLECLSLNACGRNQNFLWMYI